MKSKNLHVGEQEPATGVMRAWWPALMTAAAIFLASSTTGSSLPGGWFPGSDKIAHLLVYALLGAFVARAIWFRSTDPTLLRVITWATALSTLYGLSDEVHQLFVAGRRFDLWDLAADGVGAFLGAVLRSWSRRGH